jgi:hypothetical protein
MYLSFYVFPSFYYEGRLVGSMLPTIFCTYVEPENGDRH